MNLWKTELLKISKSVFGNGGNATDVQSAICFIAAFLAVILALKWLGKNFGAKMADNGRVITVVIAGIILAMASAAATSIYIIPKVNNAILIKWLPLASCAVIMLVIIIPMICLILKSKYFQALWACLLSIGAAAVVVLLVHGAFGALKAGDKGFEKTRTRTEEVNDFLKK